MTGPGVEVAVVCGVVVEEEGGGQVVEEVGGGQVGEEVGGGQVRNSH